MAMNAHALCAEMVARAEKKPADRRSEARHENVVDCSTLFFRGTVRLVPVINISTRGAMIAADLEPRIGESVVIRFEGCSPIYASVRWARNGRIGLAFGTELIIG